MPGQPHLELSKSCCWVKSCCLVKNWCMCVCVCLKVFRKQKKVPKDSSLGRWPFSLLNLIQPYRQILLGCRCKDTTAPKPDPSTSALQVCFPENEICFFSESWDVQRTHGTPDRMTKRKALPRSLYHKVLTFRETSPLEHLCSNFSLKLYARSQVG